MSDATDRLQTGWQPTRGEIPAEVPQHHLERWRFIWSVRKRRVLLLGDSPKPPAEPGYQELTEDVLWIDAGRAFLVYIPPPLPRRSVWTAMGAGGRRHVLVAWRARCSALRDQTQKRDLG